MSWSLINWFKIGQECQCHCLAAESIVNIVNRSRPRNEVPDRCPVYTTDSVRVESDIVPELGGFYLCWKVHTIQEFHL